MKIRFGGLVGQTDPTRLPLLAGDGEQGIGVSGGRGDQRLVVEQG